MRYGYFVRCCWTMLSWLVIGKPTINSLQHVPSQMYSITAQATLICIPMFHMLFQPPCGTGCIVNCYPLQLSGPTSFISTSDCVASFGRKVTHTVITVPTYLCLPTPGEEGKEGGHHDSTLTATNTSHTRPLPLTLTKPAAEEVSCLSSRPHEFPACLHTP